jgi:hypothetical protein
MIEAKWMPRRAFLAGVSILGRLGVLAAVAAWPTSSARAGGPRKSGQRGLTEGAKPKRASLATFAPLVGSVFRVEVKPKTFVGIKLVDGSQLPMKDQPGAHRDRHPFSLMFMAPRPATLKQDTYVVHHPKLGSFSLFLVPVGPPEAMVFYEAVFG